MGGARWRVVSPLGKMSDNNVRYRTFGCGLRPVSVYSSIDGRSYGLWKLTFPCLSLV